MGAVDIAKDVGLNIEQAANAAAAGAIDGAKDLGQSAVDAVQAVVGDAADQAKPAAKRKASPKKPKA
jgi:hypothetical protein